ncbi:hypothetical protein AMJ44_02685 [candidate division WOR-1 bacterium DG_54_3]|uniref:Uncharacterized protein n=1 Tax=candidate division WOR-1 bacterium DG_54_3 TaxID=1703775 RepID=A0A0S7Y4Q4_UNCSA|nr:MAG: hypothetical protein AMJ44_02685 [candidate division WOR-1 bacterium DG_54_3]
MKKLNIVDEYGAKRRFYPSGPRISYKEFRYASNRSLGKIIVSQKLIGDYGLCSRTSLGNELLFNIKVNEIADQLYSQNIHFGFFAEALHVIGRNAKVLGPVVKCILLRKLSRNSIASALRSGAISEDDIGRNFKLFFGKIDRTVQNKRPDQEKLDILQRLGVLVLEPGCSLPIVSRSRTPIRGPSKPAKYPHPRPPIEKVDPEEIIKKKQLSLPGMGKPESKD